MLVGTINWYNKGEDCVIKENHMKKFHLSLVLTTLIAISLTLINPKPASAGIHIDQVGLQGELVQLKDRLSPLVNDNAVLLGATVSFNGLLEVRPQIAMSDGQYRAFLLDLGIRVTPALFDFDEYLFGIISPYAALGLGIGYPFSGGYYAKVGLGLDVFSYFLVNAELGYRSQNIGLTLTSDNQPINRAFHIDGLSLTLRIGKSF